MQQSATTPHNTPHYHTTTHHTTPHTQLNHYTTPPTSHQNSSMHVPKIKWDNDPSARPHTQKKTNCHKNTDQHSSSIIFCLVCDKWIKHTLQHCLWTMHSPQAPTMLDFASSLRNAVWIKINFCKLNDIWRARGRQEGQGKINLGHARTCGVTMACTSKWQKMPLDHAQLTNTYHAGLWYYYEKCGLDKSQLL